jgi:hypothetical protein
MYAEYAGLTSEAVTLIEHLRKSPSESKSDILVRILSPLVESSRMIEPSLPPPRFLNLGQGARLVVGEKAFLFLSKAAKKANRADAEGEVRTDGLYLNGQKVKASRANPLQAAMRLVQERKGHRNDSGQIISLSAWRQWHVIRSGHLIPIFELKDRAMAHTRGRRLLTKSDQSAEELGL